MYLVSCSSAARSRGNFLYPDFTKSYMSSIYLVKFTSELQEIDTACVGQKFVLPFALPYSKSLRQNLELTVIQQSAIQQTGGDEISVSA